MKLVMSKSKIKFYLNDKQVEANNDETIWQVANRLGTEIPHLCYTAVSYTHLTLPTTPYV